MPGSEYGAVVTAAQWAGLGIEEKEQGSAEHCGNNSVGI